MHNETQVLEKVRAVVIDIIDVEPSAIVPAANLRDDLRADSLASAEIIMALEDAFNIEFSEEKVSALLTVEDLIAAIGHEIDKSASLAA